MTRGITSLSTGGKCSSRRQGQQQRLSTSHPAPITSSFSLSTPVIVRGTVSQDSADHHNDRDNDDSHSQSTTTTDLESPTKRYKGMVLQTPYQTTTTTVSMYSNSNNRSMSPTRRGRGYSNNNTNEDGMMEGNRIIIDNTNLVDREHASRKSQRFTMDGIASQVSSLAADESVAGESEASGSVAHLRGWLDDFGKQQKKHYNAGRQALAADEVQRPTRPKVNTSAHKKPTPLPKQAAMSLAKRLVDTGLPMPNSRSSATPIRIQLPAKTGPDVRATNDGYKSVKELSAWLADDPTRTKKPAIRSLRRGANVIAKSRAFDKGLADVIIEQDYGMRTTRAGQCGLVASKKQMLAADGVVESEVEDDVDDDGITSLTESAPGYAAWPDPLETSSSISVSDKKQWLKNAFKRNSSHNNNNHNAAALSGFLGGHATATMPKAHTEVVTAQDEREAVSNRAKHLWRAAARSKRNNTSNPIANQAESTPATTTTTMPMETPVDTTDAPSSFTSDDVMKSPDEKYTFSAARDYLVKKSRQNGNPVDVANHAKQVKSRMAKFEWLEKEAARRKSSNSGGGGVATKTSWVAASQGRTFVKQVNTATTAPKKHLDELP